MDGWITSGNETFVTCAVLKKKQKKHMQSEQAHLKGPVLEVNVGAATWLL